MGQSKNKKKIFQILYNDEIFVGYFTNKNKKYIYDKYTTKISQINQITDKRYIRDSQQ